MADVSIDLTELAPDQNAVHAASPASILSIRGLSRQFGATLALDRIDLDLQRGEILCLVGHSGCGKTSLLRMIAGIDMPDSGTIVAGNEVLVAPNRFVEPEKRRIGVVFQDYALFPHLTIQENILFGLTGMAREEARQRARTMLQLVGLENMADRYPHMLSGGEQQRIALARALAPKPDILLMDEPFSNLDRGLRARVRHETVALLRKLGIAAVVVTHESDEALSTGDRVVLMRAGQIVQAGSARHLYAAPVNRYAAEFFDHCNLIEGELRDGHFVSALGRFALPAGQEPQASGRIWMGLRPDHLHISPDGSGIACIVTDHVYYGRDEELLLQVVDNGQMLLLRSHGLPDMRGKQVAIRVASEGAFLFADN